ncbi:helix-turn-helix transcriptional regulator [Streptomyces sp. NPDC057909]|uniref:helix-turn-helix transcriptional regulator n=1 Tax=Streptomyces sp. NPDC057909 TaxID=3346277 RepID=UPI0036E97926
MRKAQDSNDQPMRIYNRLAMLRAERGWSRRYLAEATEVNYQTIGYLERGEYNPSLELVFRICACFGLPVEAVFSPRPFPRLTGEVLVIETPLPSAESRVPTSASPKEKMP